MDDPMMSTGQTSPRSPSSSIDKDDTTHSSHSPTASITDANPGQCHTVLMCGQPIAALMIDSSERLCLAQISNTLLKNFSYNEIHNRRVALGITCVQCTPVQLEILRRAGAMPVSSRRCGMISKREAERLCKSFLCDNRPPKLPDNFAFEVYHSCSWGCRGNFVPSRYNSSRAKCIKCIYCNLYFSPNKFIFHSHRTPTSKYHQPDAANFNSWRRHIVLSEDEPGEALLHAWEDVKAMFNGGSRKRSMYHSTTTTPSTTKTTHKTSPLGLAPPVPKSSRLDLDPVINNLSLGRGIAYPIMPIPNRSFQTAASVSESITSEKRDTFFSPSPNSVFGRQFTTQSMRPRTFSDLFWTNGRVPYPFPTGIWPPKTRDNFALLSAGTASMDKQLGTSSYCPIAPESFLGNWPIPNAPNIIDSEREKIKEDIKMRSIPTHNSDVENSSKYMSAFRRVGKITSPERDLGYLENNDMDRYSPTSPPDARDGGDSSYRASSFNTASKRLFATYDHVTVESDTYVKEDDGSSYEYVEELEGRKKEESPVLEAGTSSGREGSRDNKGDHREEGISEDVTDGNNKTCPESPTNKTGDTDLFPKASLRGAVENTDDSDESAASVVCDHPQRRTPTTDTYEGFMKREMQFRHLKDQLCLELEQERKARLTTQQKLKEAQETLQEFSYKMLLSRHCVDGATTSYQRTAIDKVVHKD